MKKLLCIKSTVSAFDEGSVYKLGGSIVQSLGYGGWFENQSSFVVPFNIDGDSVFLLLEGKSPIRMVNRAFRRLTRHWVGAPGGFTSKKAHRAWCREMAREHWQTHVTEMVMMNRKDGAWKLTYEDIHNSVLDDLECWS